MIWLSIPVFTGLLFLHIPDGSSGVVEVGLKYVVAWKMGDGGVCFLYPDMWNDLLE